MKLGYFKHRRRNPYAGTVDDGLKALDHALYNLRTALRYMPLGEERVMVDEAMGGVLHAKDVLREIKKGRS
jgi:hypothetical protein